MSIPRRPIKRAFTGLAGSPLAATSQARATELAPVATASKNKGGRPPKNAVAMTAAERKRKSREVLAAKLEELSQREDFRQMFLAAASTLFPGRDLFSNTEIGSFKFLPGWDKLGTEELWLVLEAIRTPENDEFISKILGGEQHEASAELEEINQPHASNDFMRNAPSGKGQLVTGGYDSTKVEQVLAAHELAERNRELNGPKGGPTGHAPQFEDDAGGRELVSQFMRKLRFGKKSSKLSESEIEKVIEKIVVEHFDNEGTKEWSDHPHKWGDTFRCKLAKRHKPCGFLAANWYEAVKHLVEDHHKIVRKRVKEATPRHWSKPKPKCTDQDHAETIERLRVRGEKVDDLHCGRCGHLLSFVTSVQLSCLQADKADLGAENRTNALYLH